VWQRVLWVVVIALLVLSGVAAFRNVFSDDAAVRAQAEKLAREKAGCGASCALTRTEGSRGVLSETLDYTFVHAGAISVTCRRAYVAFGDYECAAAKR
jgi:hypothetical protein